MARKKIREYDSKRLQGAPQAPHLDRPPEQLREAAHLIPKFCLSAEPEMFGEFARSAEAVFSRWAIKRVCKFLLKKKHGDLILGDIDLDQLDVELGQGTIQLSDLTLNVDYLNQDIQISFEYPLQIRLILIMVWRKLIWIPNTYSSLLGLIWSLVSFRWGTEMPAIVAHSISILSDAGLVMAMVSLGIFIWYLVNRRQKGHLL